MDDLIVNTFIWNVYNGVGHESFGTWVTCCINSSNGKLFHTIVQKIFRKCSDFQSKI